MQQVVRRQTTNEAMSDRIACPSCGFQNFAISSICGRCERALSKEENTAAEVVVPNTPAFITTPKTPPPIATMPQPQTTGRKTGSLNRPALAAIPPPQLPKKVEAKVAPLPISIPVVPNAKKRKPAKTKAPTAQQRLMEGNFAAALPGMARVVGAWLVDAGLAGSLGFALAVTEAILLEESVRGLSPTAVDAIAHWIHGHSGPTFHGVIFALLIGFAQAVVGGRGSGQTLGRKLMGTVLIPLKGREPNVVQVLLRAILAMTSALLFGAGFWLAVVDRRSRCLHDILSGMVVVRKRVSTQA